MMTDIIIDEFLEGSNITPLNKTDKRYTEDDMYKFALDYFDEFCKPYRSEGAIDPLKADKFLQEQIKRYGTSKPSLFEVLHTMNVHDTEHKTEFVQLSNHFVSAKTVKQGATITMGAEAKCLLDLGKRIPILLLVDKEEYDKLNTK
jgi:hypothetical protein